MKIEKQNRRGARLSSFLAESRPLKKNTNFFHHGLDLGSEKMHQVDPLHGRLQ